MCQVRRGGNNFDNIFPVVTKDNNIFELQGFMEHNDLTSIIAIEFLKNTIYVSNKHNWITKKILKSRKKKKEK